MDEFIQSQTDVLIVGAGPAGCMAAPTLARYGEENKRAATQAGHASAFQPRTQEILQTLSLRIEEDELGYRLTETSFWSIDEYENLSRNSVGCEVIHSTPYQYLFNSDQGITGGVFGGGLISRVFRVGPLLGVVSDSDED
ncbi:hypothetical protein NA56DRAFT_754079 [Hyaloscypha hepaticicola]|uniref:FAD-binding domain-containing protein n=1 Tax=Hyaloscypha hepaticicola TaxID=2082293 RepID=A0A2J6PMR9_9HELO|nr:hypothetical protein NA56DRAFT_754079 [Hyaloscypha hepaticicola]